MKPKIDHVGVAVTDLEAAIKVWRDVLGLHLDGFEDVPDQRVRVAKMRAGDDVVELLAPTSDDSPIKKFLDKRGPGIHHICIAVDDIDASLARCQAQGVELIDKTARPGADGARIAFVHPRSTGGVLIELSEKGHHG